MEKKELTKNGIIIANADIVTVVNQTNVLSLESQY